MVEKTNLLSNPTLDQAYAIRRVFVNMYLSSQRMQDSFGMNYYHDKVTAMDQLIGAFIVTEDVPEEHIEQGLPQIQPAKFAPATEPLPSFLRMPAEDRGYNAVKEALDAPKAE